EVRDERVDQLCVGRGKLVCGWHGPLLVEGLYHRVPPPTGIPGRDSTEAQGPDRRRSNRPATLLTRPRSSRPTSAESASGSAHPSCFATCSARVGPVSAFHTASSARLSPETCPS